jgi:hypothetical protein
VQPHLIVGAAGTGKVDHPRAQLRHDGDAVDTLLRRIAKSRTPSTSFMTCGSHASPAPTLGVSRASMWLTGGRFVGAPGTEGSQGHHAPPRSSKAACRQCRTTQTRPPGNVIFQLARLAALILGDRALPFTELPSDHLRKQHDIGRWAQDVDHQPFEQGYVAGWQSVRGADDQPVLIPPSPVFAGSAMYMVGYSRGARDAGV